MDDRLEDFEDVSLYTIDEAAREALLATQRECAVVWSTREGWPVERHTVGIATTARSSATSATSAMPEARLPRRARVSSRHASATAPASAASSPPAQRAAAFAAASSSPGRRLRAVVT